MKRKTRGQLWLAVKVWRGFPAEVKGFRKRRAAERQEQLWRKRMNLDYDETCVLPLTMSDPESS